MNISAWGKVFLAAFNEKMSKYMGQSSVVAGFELNLSVSFSCVGVFFLKRIDGIRVRGLFVFLGKKGCQGCVQGLFWLDDFL